MPLKIYTYYTGIQKFKSIAIQHYPQQSVNGNSSHIKPYIELAYKWNVQLPFLLLYQTYPNWMDLTSIKITWWRGLIYLTAALQEQKMSQRKQENKCVFKWKKTRKKCNEKKVIKADKNIKQELKFKRIMQRTRWKNTIEQEEYLKQENWWQEEKTNKNKRTELKEH